MHSQLQFCETTLSTGVEIFNTVSSFAYIFVGIYILYFSLTSKKDKRFTVMGLLAVLLGIGSMALHIFKTQESLFIDFFTMQILLTYIISTFFLPHYKRALIIASVTASFISIFLNNIFILLVFFALVGLLTFFHQLATNKVIQSYFVVKLGSAALIIGILLWILDISKIYCSDTILPINGHVIWHIATAVIVFCVYKLIAKLQL